MTELNEQLMERLSRIKRLAEVAGLLGWDQQTYMPQGAAAARGEQGATLSRLMHEMFVSAETGTLLEQAERASAGQDPDSDNVRMLAAALRARSGDFPS